MFSLKRLGHLLPKRHFSISRVVNGTRYPTDLYEPDYLDSLKPDTPVYENLNIQITGYDYPILESFQGQVNRIANILDIDVEDSWAIPPKKIQVQRYKPFSTVVDSVYNLNIYERNLQVTDVPSMIYPIFLRLIQECTPEGVKVSVIESQPEHQEIRYIPDTQLLNLKQELAGFGEVKKKKKF